jgi:hypothetical protein
MTPNSGTVLATRTVTYLGHVRLAHYVGNLPAICTCFTRYAQLARQ